MVTTLPRPVQLKLELTLQQWQHWRCDPPLRTAPTVERILTGGISNFSILVREKNAFVVRIDGINTTRHGLNRQTEWRALQTASAANLAPQPRYFNPELGSLVCDFLAHEDSAPQGVRTVARLLRAIHRLPPLHSRLHLAERVRQYEKLIPEQNTALLSVRQTCGREITALLRQHRDQADATVLCHNDLLRANRLQVDNRLYAIDWEYSAMGSPWYDMAVVAVGDALDQKATHQLLQEYLGEVPADRHLAKLRRYSCIYRYIELLWYGGKKYNTKAQFDIEIKLQSLHRELAALS